MRERIGQHIRSNVVGYVALFVALSGTAYAAATIGAGDIKDNAVHSRHIKNGQVKSVDVADGALTGSDISSDAITPTEIADIGELFSTGQFAVNPSSGETQTVTLIDDGDLSLRGSCQRTVGDAMTAKLLVASSLTGSAFTSSATPDGFTVSPGDGNKEVGTLASATGTFKDGLISYALTDEFAAAWHGTVSGAVNTPFNGPNDCVFTGFALG